MPTVDRRPTPSNEQSLFEDEVLRAFAARDVTAPDLRWTGPRTLAVVLDPGRWGTARPIVADLQGRGADRGFKVLLRGPVITG